MCKLHTGHLIALKANDSNICVTANNERCRSILILECHCYVAQEDWFHSTMHTAYLRYL